MQQPCRGEPGSTWAYIYRIVSPQGLRLDTIRTIVERENAAALEGAGGWAGRIIPEPLLTYILVISASAEQSLDVNHRLEAELKRLKADFLRTCPVAICPGGEDADDGRELLRSIDLPSLN